MQGARVAGATFAGVLRCEDPLEAISRYGVISY